MWREDLRLLTGFLFVPSVLIFLLILAAFILFFLKRRRIGKWALGTGLLFLYFFSIQPVAQLLLFPLQAPYGNLSIPRSGKIHRAVLLLGGYGADQLRATGILQVYFGLPPEARKRFVIYISGMNPANPLFPEAWKVREFLTERGIPSDRVLLETESQNTMQSVVNLREKIGTTPFFLVTSAYHMTRSLLAFRALGLNPVPVATDFKIENRLFDWPILLPELFPSGEFLWDSDVAFHEYEGLLFYRLRYRSSSPKKNNR